MSKFLDKLGKKLGHIGGTVEARVNAALGKVEGNVTTTLARQIDEAVEVTSAMAQKLANDVERNGTLRDFFDHLHTAQAKEAKRILKEEMPEDMQQSIGGQTLAITKASLNPATYAEAFEKTAQAHGKTDLSKAAARGDVDKINTLIADGADITERDNQAAKTALERGQNGALNALLAGHFRRNHRAS